MSVRCCGSVGSTIVSEVMNLRKLAQARPTMPCIPLVIRGNGYYSSVLKALQGPTDRGVQSQRHVVAEARVVAHVLAGGRAQSTAKHDGV